MVGDCEKGHGIKTKYLVAASAIVDEMGTVFECGRRWNFCFLARFVVLKTRAMKIIVMHSIETEITIYK